MSYRDPKEDGCWIIFWMFVVFLAVIGLTVALSKVLHHFFP